MSGKNTLVVDAKLDRLDDIRQFVERSARSLGAEESAIIDLRLAVDEAVTNIIVHGYKVGPGSVEVDIHDNAGALVVRLRDDAPAFDPCKHAVADLGASLEKDTPGGFGLHLIKQVVDEVSYSVSRTGGNELTLIKQNAVSPP